VSGTEAGHLSKDSTQRGYLSPSKRDIKWDNGGTGPSQGARDAVPPAGHPGNDRPGDGLIDDDAPHLRSYGPPAATYPRGDASPHLGDANKPESLG
jgi:hypothetical protein